MFLERVKKRVSASELHHHETSQRSFLFEFFSAASFSLIRPSPQEHPRRLSETHFPAWNARAHPSSIVNAEKRGAEGWEGVKQGGVDVIIVVDVVVAFFSHRRAIIDPRLSFATTSPSFFPPPSSSSLPQQAERGRKKASTLSGEQRRKERHTVIFGEEHRPVGERKSACFVEK